MTPPVAPARPTTIYLCDYGYHSSLLLPVSDGVYVEYLYGDWDWAALNQSGVWPVVRAGLFSSGATLGRRYTYDARPGAVPRPMSMPEKQLPLVVDGAACRRLQLELDARWRAHADTAVNPGPVGSGYLFVRDDDPYGLLHNCNRVNADWLDRLGCRTGGWPLLSHFSVETPEPKDTPGRGQ